MGGRGALRYKPAIAGTRPTSTYSVLPHGHADRHVVAGAVLRFRRDPARSTDLDQARHRHRRRLFRHVEPKPLPENKITRRQASIKRVFPDALDLLLICIESGMSVEAAFQKVSDEVGTQSVELAGGIDANHRRAVISAGSPAGLRQSGATGWPGRCKRGLSRLAAGGALRHAARHHDAGTGAGKPRHAHVGSQKKAAALPPNLPCR